MRCPTLNDLPPPPPGKTGWPWTEESPQLPDRMPDARPWPRICIVTPSYNQGQFIEETIRSVLLQGYPDLEYIVMDGESTDGTVEIIKRYERWIAHWVSEKDEGQAQAINKGFTKATGAIVAWLNSDDIYFQGTFQYIGVKYSGSEEDKFWLVAGVEYLDTESGNQVVDFQKPWFDIMDWVLGGAQIHQQGAFWARAIQAIAGSLVEDLHYGFDKEFFARLVSLGYQYQCPVDIVVARYRQHSLCKWKRDFPRFKYDWLRVSMMYLPRDLRDFCKIKRELKNGLAFWRIRFSQDSSSSRCRRLWELVTALYLNPAVICQRVYWGSLCRIVIRL